MGPRFSSFTGFSTFRVTRNMLFCDSFVCEGSVPNVNILNYLLLCCPVRVPQSSWVAIPSEVAVNCAWSHWVRADGVTGLVASGRASLLGSDVWKVLKSRRIWHTS